MRLIFIAFLLLPYLSTQAQMVQSNAYNITLNTLLSHSVHEVSVQQVRDSNDALLLDAREWNEYQVSHLKKARFVGYELFDLNKVSDIGKNQKIVVYCSVGYRSEKIAEKLKEAGYTNVSNLYGGIFEWVNQGNSVVDSRNMETANIHAYSKTWGVWLTRGNKVYDSK